MPTSIVETKTTASRSTTKQTQQYLGFAEFEMPSRHRSMSSATSLQEQSSLAEYASVKRVSLVYENSLHERPCISSSGDATSFFKRYWEQTTACDQEKFVVACLDTKNRVQSVVIITVGTLDASLVHPREVFKPAFIEGSSSIIISHNHPSGNPTPSREDIAVTQRLTDAGKLLGIDVLDHIVYGDGTGEAISIREFN